VSELAKSLDVFVEASDRPMDAARLGMWVDALTQRIREVAGL